MASLPPVQRIRSSKRRIIEKQEWIPFLAIQRHLNMNATYSQSPRPNRARCKACAISHASQNKSSVTNSNGPKPKAPHVGSNSTAPVTKQEIPVVCSSPVFGDNKSFLEAFQVLEKLSKLVKSFSDDDSNEQCVTSDDALPYVPCSQQKSVICLYEKLQGLLKRRCMLALKKECVAHIQDAKTFVQDLKAYLKDEYSKFCLLNSCQKSDLKQKTLERFYLCRKSSLLEELQKHLHLWPSVVRNVSRIVAIFHMDKDGAVESLLIQTHATLSKLQNEALFWVYKILQVNLQIVCCIEPFSVPYETLQHIFHVCDSYTLMLMTVKESQHPQRWCGIRFVCSDLCLLCSIEPLPLSLILRILASHQALLASDKLSAYLLSEARRESKSKSKLKDCTSLWLPEGPTSGQVPFSRQRTNETSDYYSASTSDLSSAQKLGDNLCTLEVLPTEGSSINLPSVLGIIIQCNQTLLLKYLFAFTNTSPPFVRRADFGNLKGKKSKGPRPLWQIPIKCPRSQSCSHIERTYWYNFWKQLVNKLSDALLIMPQKKLLDNFVPCGTLMLCPRSMLFVILTMLREATTNSDLSSEAMNTLQEIHWRIFKFAILSTWDESLSMAVTNMQIYRLSAIPLIKGGAGTTVGNALFSSFSPLVGSITFAYQTNYLHKSHLTMLLLNMTLDALISWIDSKQKGLLYSWNISLFLLMSCSDLKRISDLVNKVVCLSSLQEVSAPPISTNSMKRMLSALWTHLFVSSQIIQDYQLALPSQLSGVTSRRVFDLLNNSAATGKEWKRYKSGRLQVQEKCAYVSQIIDDVLCPVVNTAVTLPSMVQEEVVTATMDGTSQAWMDFILRKNIRFSLRGGQQFERDVRSVCDWLEGTSLCQEEKERILTSPKVLHLLAVAKLLSMPSLSMYTSQSARRNQIAPSPALSERFENIVVDVIGMSRSVKLDVHRWLHLRTRSCFADICCSR